MTRELIATVKPKESSQHLHTSLNHIIRMKNFGERCGTDARLFCHVRHPVNDPRPGTIHSPRR